MEKIQLKELLAKYTSGECSAEETALVESWYLRFNEADRAELSEDALIQAQDKLWTGLSVKTKVRSIWPRIAAAASILLFVSIGGYFILHKPTAATNTAAQSKVNDVTPGSNSATLTLSNGKKILLNAKPVGQIAVQGNMAITKTANGQLQYQLSTAKSTITMLNTVSTRRKEQYKVVLSDGTNVWLNAASSITYPVAFTGTYREVAITGEAYFEVAHNAKKPFKVTAQGQTVEVLGTHFNINAYADEPNVKTTLLEGSVKITGNNSFKIIKPGQQAIFKNNQLLVSDANVEETVAWKNGYFRFNRENIEPIMRKLSRWYDIEVQFEGAIPDDEFSGAISRFKNISEVLKELEYYKTVHFKVEGRRVTVSK